MTATSFTVTAVTTVTKKRDMPSLWVARIVCRRIPTFLRNSAAGYHQKTGYNGYSGYGTASMRFGSAHLSDWPLGLDEEPRETVVIPLCPRSRVTPVLTVMAATVKVEKRTSERRRKWRTYL